MLDIPASRPDKATSTTSCMIARGAISYRDSDPGLKPDMTAITFAPAEETTRPVPLLALAGGARHPRRARVVPSALHAGNRSGAAPGVDDHSLDRGFCVFAAPLLQGVGREQVGRKRYLVCSFEALTIPWEKIFFGYLLPTLFPARFNEMSSLRENFCRIQTF